MSFAVEYAYPRMAPAPDLAASIAALSGPGKLATVGFEARVDAIAELPRLITAARSTLRSALPAEGLAFLASFLSREHLVSLVGREVRDIEALSRFVRVESRKSIRMVPKGLVCHWVAGNVPLLALFSWAISAVLGNRNLIRLSARQGDVVSPLLDALQALSDTGRLIADETHVVWFDRHDHAAHASMSQAADVRIAWGGREAVDAIHNLQRKWDCEDIIFGPRMSFAAIDPQMIDAAGIRRLATDAVLFDQLACSSPQYIFVKGERGSRRVDDFVTRFSAAFAEQGRAYPRDLLGFSETFRIHLDRVRVLLNGGDIRRDGATSWTVAVVDTPLPQVTCANRFLQVIPFNSLDEIYARIPGNVQTVIINLDATDTSEFTEHAAHLGVCRFPRPGEGNHFENPWDGAGLVSRLTRSVIRTDAAS